MNRRLATLLFCFCIALPAAFGACPVQGALTALTLGTLETTPAVMATVPSYCKRLNGGTIKACCAASVVNGLQTTSDTTKNDWATTAGARDQAILDARRNVLSLKSNYTALQTLLAASKTNLDAWAAQSADATLQTNAGKIKTFVTDFNDFFDKVITGYDGIFANFETYQTNRATCINKVLELAANARCYACGDDSDADITAAGVFTLDANVKTALAGACYDYINGSDYQNNILQINAYNKTLGTFLLNAALLANNTSSGVAAFVTALGVVAADTKTYPPGDKPATCTSATACDWATTTLWNNAVITAATVKDAILRGGDLYTFKSRILKESEGRSLAFTATTASAGITPGFVANPGNVKNVRDPGASALRVGAISSLVALFVAFLF